MSIVKQVREYAVQNCDRDGWDFLVECWEDADIQEYMGDAEDLETAILRCRSVTRTLDGQRREIRATAEW
jgi:hypothetical protein